MLCWNRLLCAFHSLLLVLALESTQPGTNPSPTGQPQVWEGVPPCCSSPGKTAQGSSCFLPCWCLAIVLPAVPLSHVGHVIPMLSVFLYQIVAKPWTFLIIPAPQKKAGLEHCNCRGSPDTARALRETEVK